MRIQISYVSTLLLLILMMNGPLMAQDTLHLNYHHTQVLPHDSTQARIDKWVKSLGGKHQDIKVVAYYHRPEFKKFAQQRCDELFLVLNRKARSLITIEFIGPKKGEDWQRTMVDIIYLETGTAAKIAAAEAAKAEALKAEAAKKKEEESKAKPEEKTAKKEAVKSEEKKKSKTEVVAEAQDQEKGKKGKAEAGKEPEKKDEKNEDELTPEEKMAEKSGKYPARRRQAKVGLNEEDIALVKSAKIVLTTAGISRENDKMLRDAVKAFWTFNSNIEVMPYDSAATLAKKDKTIILMFITRLVTKSVTHSSGNYTIAKSRAVVIEKGKMKPIYTMCFPEVEGDKPVSQEFVNFAVAALNSLFTNMDEQGLKKIRTFNTPFEKHSAELKDRTLLIPSTMLAKKVLPADVGNYYRGKFQVVDYASYADAINKRKPCAYVVPVPLSMGGSIIYYDYLIDAETGKVYYIHTPKMMQGFKIAGPLGGVHDLAHSERINSKNLENYNKAFEKKSGKDEEEEVIKDAAEETVEAGEKKEPAKAEEKKASKSTDKEKAKTKKDKE